MIMYYNSIRDLSIYISDGFHENLVLTISWRKKNKN